MLAERPNLLVYAELSDNLYELKKQLGKAEWELDKVTAVNMKSAIKRKATGKETDVVKVIGEDQDDLRLIEDLRNKILNLKKEIGVTQGKLKVWEFTRDLYISDSYHQVRGTMKHFASGDED